MAKIILDVSNLYLEEVVENINMIKDDLIGVIVSCDVKNYDDLYLKAKTLFNKEGVKVFKGVSRAIMDNSYNQTQTLEYKNDTVIDENEDKAANFILKELCENEEADIITFGPLTNIALAYLKDEKSFNTAKNIYVVAGALLGYQTTTPTSHHSILADTHAANLILKSDLHITLIPPHTLKNPVKDALSIYKGSEYEYYNAFLEVDTSNSLSRGQTIIDVAGKNPITHTVTTGRRKKVVKKMI